MYGHVDAGEVAGMGDAGDAGEGDAGEGDAGGEEMRLIHQDG